MGIKVTQGKQRDGGSRVHLKPQPTRRTSYPYHKSATSVTAKGMTPRYVYFAAENARAWSLHDLSGKPILTSLLQKIKC